MIEKLKRIISVMLSVLIAILYLSGCGDDGVKRVSKKYKAIEGSSAESGIFASDEDYQLLWDSDYNCVFLADTGNENIWSSIPYDYYLNGDFEGVAGVRLNSELELEYYDTNDRQLKTVYSSVEAEQNGVISSSIENGVLTVVYDFSNIEISIPVEYSLVDGGLMATVRVDKIKENENMVYSVGLLPFIASAKATDDENSYLVVPSGSGALMYLDENKRQPRNIVTSVYGEDYSVTAPEKNVYSENTFLPFYGVKNNDKALMAVITSGAELSEIKAQAGDPEIGYGSVYATFNLRGRDTAYVPASTGYKEAVVKYTEQMALVDKLSVCFYPLAGENSDYVGMARFYSENFVDFSDASEEKELYLQFYGAAKVKKSFFGVPYRKLQPITTVEKAGEIAEKLNSVSSGMAVQLVGYGESGLDIGEIAGGYTVSSKLGGIKEYLKLQSDLRSKNIPLYLNIDLLNFSESGSKVRVNTDCAHTANGLNVKRKFYSISLPSEASGSYDYHLLRRDKLQEIFKTLLNKCDKIDGFSLASVGNTVYSDYRNQSTYARANYVSEASKLMESAKKEHTLAFSKPNSYALGLADDIFGIPTKSSGYDGFDLEVPIYAIICKGNVGFSVPPINIQNDTNREYLKAVEVGAGLGFAFSDKWSEEFITSFQSALNVSTASDWMNSAEKLLKEYGEYFEAVRGATIVSHDVLEDGVTHTVFDNGIYAIVNFSDSAYKEIAAGSYTWGRGGET